MTHEKIKVALAEDLENHRNKIKLAVNRTQNYELIFSAVNGRDLILQILQNPKKQPAIILMDMQMPCCDGLLCTTICKWLFPQIKIIGFSAHTDERVVQEFLAEKGDGFLSKLIISSISKFVYNQENMLEVALNNLLAQSNSFIDKLLEPFEQVNNQLESTNQLIAKNCSHLLQDDIKYLQLNAAGFDNEQMGKILNKSKWTVKKCGDKLRKEFNVKTHSDLTNFAISFGIVKLVRIYQPPKELEF